MKKLKTGEKRTIRHKYSFPSSKMFDVVAHCVDSETPVVILRFYDYNKNIVFESYLSDVDATDMGQMLLKALTYLPTSK